MLGVVTGTPGAANGDSGASDSRGDDWDLKPSGDPKADFSPPPTAASALVVRHVGPHCGDV